MHCSENQESPMFRPKNLRDLSERIRNLDKYNASKLLELYYTYMMVELGKADIYDVAHLLGSLALIDHEIAIKFILDNREKLASKILSAKPEEIKELLLTPYRLNRVTGTFIALEFEKELIEIIKRNLDKFSLLKHGLIISSVSRCSPKVARKLIDMDDIQRKICKAIEEEKFDREPLERIGSFFCSLMLGDRGLAEEISKKCQKSLIRRLELEINETNFEDLGVFLSCLSRANRDLRELIIKRHKEDIISVFDRGVARESISDIRVILEGISFTSKELAWELYHRHKKAILEKLMEADNDKVDRFLKSMKKANEEIFEDLKKSLTSLGKQISP